MTQLNNNNLLHHVVPEEKPADKEELNGVWSPWSTLQSPCFKLKTGREVDCGGGVQYRYRSCTNPVPRFGGRKCPGLDYEETPCNTHACACKEIFYMFMIFIFLIFYYYGDNRFVIL